MENDLAARVMSLPREIVLEAARFVAEDLVTDPPTAGEVAWVGDQPLAHVQDVEVLARLVRCAVQWRASKAQARSRPQSAEREGRTSYSVVWRSWLLRAWASSR